MTDTTGLAAPFALPVEVTEPDLLAKYFMVLSDPTRLKVLELLDSRGELAVGEIVQALGQSQSKVSNHLACLRWCGFVVTRREHPSVLYRVADTRVWRSWRSAVPCWATTPSTLLRVTAPTARVADDLEPKDRPCRLGRSRDLGRGDRRGRLLCRRAVDRWAARVVGGRLGLGAGCRARRDRGRRDRRCVAVPPHAPGSRN